jgi:hypothetical protein
VEVPVQVEAVAVAPAVVVLRLGRWEVVAVVKVVSSPSEVSSRGLRGTVEPVEPAALVDRAALAASAAWVESWSWRRRWRLLPEAESILRTPRSKQMAATDRAASPESAGLPVLRAPPGRSARQVPRRHSVPAELAAQVQSVE